MQSTAEIARAGIRSVLASQFITERKAAIRAGINQNQINRFMNGSDIRLKNLDRFCNKGLLMSTIDVLIIGTLTL